MEYQIVVKPGKEEAFEQLLQSWQTLGLVISYMPLSDEEASTGNQRQEGKLVSSQQSKTTATDSAHQYRDLVD